MARSCGDPSGGPRREHVAANDFSTFLPMLSDFSSARQPCFIHVSELSIQNSANRANLPSNHRGGSKPFIAHLEDQRNPETQELPGRIEFYRLMHFDTRKGWICPLARANYERMIELKSQDPPEGSSPKTEDEIFEIVCGKRSGYVLGLGHGKIPPSKSSSFSNQHEVEEIRQRAESAERQNEELATQLHDQGLEIEEMKRWRLSMEANMGPFMANMANMGPFMSLLAGNFPSWPSHKLSFNLDPWLLLRCFA